MKNLVFYILIVSFTFIIIMLPSALNAQTKDKKANKIQLKNWNEVEGGELFVTVNGKKKKIADYAIKAWIINDGKDVIYSARDGAGGFENEGQSLRIYEVQYDFTRKILSEYFGITTVGEKKLSNGQTALLVRMGDGGLGGEYFAVVDSKRGEVFFRDLAELIEVSGDTITLGFYQADDFHTINKARGYENKLIPKPTKVKPYKTETYDLKKILQNEVIYNEKLDRVNPLDRKGLKKVKIYLWRVNDEYQNQNFILSPVPRYVDPKDFLRSTLAELFKQETEDESENGFATSTFGMKFEDVVVKDGSALVKFSQPPKETNYGTLGPLIFLKAIEKTAKQFPSIQKAEVCAIGKTFIDSELDEPFQKCPK